MFLSCLLLRNQSYFIPVILCFNLILSHTHACTHINTHHAVLLSIVNIYLTHFIYLLLTSSITPRYSIESQIFRKSLKLCTHSSCNCINFGPYLCFWNWTNQWNCIAKWTLLCLLWNTRQSHFNFGFRLSLYSNHKIIL